MTSMPRPYNARWLRDRAGDNQITPLTPEQQQIVERLRRLAHLMDAAVTIPGTRFTIGLDAALGLIPGVGDALSALISGYIIAEAQRLGVSKATTARMIGNVVIDSLIGSIPVLGDLFDVAYRSNIRNLRLLGIDMGRKEPPSR